MKRLTEQRKKELKQWHIDYDLWRETEHNKFAENNQDLFDKEYLKENGYSNIEVCESGDVFVHCGGAYPMIFKNEAKTWKQHAEENNLEY